MHEKDKVNEHSKQQQLENFKVDDSNQEMTTNQGLKVLARKSIHQKPRGRRR